MSSDDDFPTLRPITTRPVALNLAAWDIESADDNRDWEAEHDEETWRGEHEEDELRCCYMPGCGETDNLKPAGLPQSDLHVCSRCDGSYQHQTDQREAWLAEESDV